MPPLPRPSEPPAPLPTCPRCSRLNPAGAAFCYFDGHMLAGAPPPANGTAPAAHHLARPFAFSPGRSCASFEDLARACQEHWDEARTLLRQGSLASFLAEAGRPDLAAAARDAARFPDADRGLDQFLAALPVEVLAPAALDVTPREIDLGTLRPGQSPHFDLRLANQGMRLLYGSLTCADCNWLALGGPAGGAEKHFACTDTAVIPVQVRGQNLRAQDKPQAATVEVESNGGTATVVVRAEVPVRPFPEGVLAGARSPRQIAEKLRAAPREAAVFLWNGAVARWYQDNGWTFPIQGPVAAGLGGVQQFFEALGLARPPRIDVNPTSVTLRGRAGDRVGASLGVRAREMRAVWALGQSDQPWLEVGGAEPDGAAATLPLTVAQVPDQPGQTLEARVKVTANGNQCFVIPVSLVVDAPEPAAVAPPAPSPPRPAPTVESVAEPAAIAAGPVSPSPVPGPRHARPPLWPAVLLVLVLLGIGVRDATLRRTREATGPDPAGTGRALVCRFHDEKGEDELDAPLPEPTMRFGLRVVRPGSTGPGPRLTFDERGRTNNTCLRLDGDERLFGSAPGRWVERAGQGWQDRDGRRHEGLRSVWAWDDVQVQVSQFVELVAGEEGGQKDTCLVRYLVENRDGREHRVGLRFLLDTFIGGNDGVPFTIPGEPDLCDDSKDFRETVPAFIQALEHEDLAHPGTVAHLRLRLGDREPPGRVTLGAWPDDNLQKLLNLRQARGVNTLWEVPVLSMKTLFPYDSAVVLYWDEKPLSPGESREVGFAYGLGSVASGARLLLTVDGSFKPGGELTVTALVSNPAADETLTLIVPAGFEVRGPATRPVPPSAEATTGGNRPVTWRVRSGGLGRHRLRVESSTGAAQEKVVVIKESSIFD